MRLADDRIEGQLVKDSPGHGRRELLGRQPVPATDDGRQRPRRGGAGQCADDVLEERLADRSRLLGPVEHGDGGRGDGQRVEQLGDRERAEQADGEHAHLCPGGVQGVGRLAGRGGGRAHHHDDPVGVGGAVVIDQVVTPLCARRQAVHCSLHDPGHCVVEAVGCLALLEKHVGVLGRAAQDGMIRREGPGSVRRDPLVVDQGPDVVVGQLLDLVDLVAGAEPVEEMQERHPPLEGSGLGDEGEIMRLLH